MSEAESGVNALVVLQFGEYEELRQTARNLRTELQVRKDEAEAFQIRAQEAEAERDTFSGQVDHLVKQVGACHTKIESLQTELDRSRPQTRSQCVRQMFVEVLPNQERNDKPTVPSDAAIRLQTRIDCEEFVEKLDAIYDDPAAVAQLKYMLRWFSERSPVRKDLHDRLPEFADALADNAVTNEGFAVLFGIDLEPVFQEVHASNLRKKDGPIDEHGKRGKPEGWMGPDVVGVLRNRGWQPTLEAASDGPLSCKLHGMIVGGGNECTRCENAQYNGSDVDPIGEQIEVVALFGRVREDHNRIRVEFETKDRALIQRIRAIRCGDREILPEIEGKTYARSMVSDIRVDHSTHERDRFVVSVGFRKVA